MPSRTPINSLGLRSAQFTRAKSQQLSIAHNSTLRANGNAGWTVSAWVYLDSLGNDYALVNKGDAGLTQIEWLISYESSTNRFIGWVSTNGSGTTAIGGGAPTVSGWNHVLLTWTGGSTNLMKLYVNAAEVASTTISAAPFAGSQPFQIGASQNAGTAQSYLSGRMALVGFWAATGMVGSSQVTALYNSGRGLAYSELAAAGVTAPTSYWNLSEVAGIRYDSAGSNDLAEPSGIPVGWNMPVYGAAPRAVQRGNRGVQLKSGSSQYLTVADNAGLSMGSNTSFTIAGWVSLDQPTTSSGLRVIAGKYNTTGNNREYELIAAAVNGGPRFQLDVTSDGTAGTINSVTEPTSNRVMKQWYFVAAWYDGANLNLQVDNGLITQAAFSAGAFDGTAAFAIGARADGTNLMDGRLDGVAVWKKVLTAAERRALFANGAGLRYADLAGVTSGSLLTSLSGWWELDEYTGSRLDSSGNANTLSENGGPIFASGGSFQGYRAVPATGERAADFRRSAQQYLSVADNANVSLNSITQAFTVAVWVKLRQRSNGEFYGVIAKETSATTTTSEYEIYISPSGAATFSVGNGAAAGSISLAGCGIGEWHLIVASYDGTAFLNLTRDTTAATPVAYAGGTQDTGNPLIIGKLNTANHWFDGQIRCVGLWKKVLSAAEITELYNAGLGLRYQEIASTSTLLTSLAAYYNLDEAGGSRACCVSASNALTENGGSIGWAKGVSGAISPALGTGDRAAQFAGAGLTQALSIAHNTSLALGDIDFSVACWFWVDAPQAGNSTSTDQTLIGKYDASGAFRGFLLWVPGGNRTVTLLVSNDGTATTSLATTATYVERGWNFVAAYHDSVNNLLGISLNGGTFLTQAYSTGVFNNTTIDWTLGAHRAGGNTTFSRNMRGRLDKVARWNKVLSQTEVATLFNSGVGLRYAGIPTGSSLLTSLQGWWDLDEVAGSRADASGNSNTLTDNGSVGWAMPVWGGRQPGKLNGDRSAQFKSASSQSLSIADNASLSMGASQAFSLACWVYLDTKNPTENTIFAKGTSAADANCEFKLGTRSAPEGFKLTVGNGATSGGVSSTLALATGTWYFLVATYDPSLGSNQLSISVNNGTATTATYASGGFDSTGSFFIGSLPGGSVYLNGRMDKAAVWKKVLSAAEITTLYNSALGLRYADIPAGSSLLTSLSAWWDLDEQSGSRLDASGNGNTLLDSGGVSWGHAVDGSG